MGAAQLSGYKMSEGGVHSVYGKGVLVTSIDGTPIDYGRFVGVPTGDWFVERIEKQYMYRLAKAIVRWCENDECDELYHVNKLLLSKGFHYQVNQYTANFNLLNPKNEREVYSFITGGVNPQNITREQVKHTVAYVFRKELTVSITLKGSRVRYARKVKRNQINRFMPYADLRVRNHNLGLAQLAIYIMEGASLD